MENLHSPWAMHQSMFVRPIKTVELHDAQQLAAHLNFADAGLTPDNATRTQSPESAVPVSSGPFQSRENFLRHL